MSVSHTAKSAQPDITTLLTRWRNGDKAAENELMDALYPAMKLSALGALRSCIPGKLSLSATELVHETYLRLIHHRNGFENRAHFLAVACQTLKRVLLDLIRARATEKRGNGSDFIALHSAELHSEPSSNHWIDSPIDLTHVINMLERLHQRDAEAARVFELRVLGGLTNDEAAEVMQIGSATATRHFAFARAWITRATR
jgi:RNA polymerase sigma factor (TIGR02999 family)